MRNQILKLSLFMFISLNISVGTLQAQPWCDTCDYSVDISNRPSDLLIPIPIFPYSDTIAYYPFCHEDSLWVKSVTFLHGLGGSAASWHKPWLWTKDTFNASATLPQYTGYELSFRQASINFRVDDVSLKGGVNSLHPTRCRKEDYVIAHSQGGIVARNLDYLWWRYENGYPYDQDIGHRHYYGIVTFATPNMGAHIGLTREEHYEMVQKIISTVVLNPLNNAKYNLAEKWFVTPSLASKLNFANDYIDSFLKSTIAPVILGSLHTPTLEEMTPGTPLINDLANYNSKIHRVAFYGIEEAPEVWRIIDMVMNEEPSDAPLFGANEDETFMNLMETVRKEHIDKISENESDIKKLRNRNNIPVYGMFHSMVKGGTIEKKILENHNRNKNLDFLNNANTQWRYIIGSYHRDSFDIETKTSYSVSYKISFMTFNRIFDDISSAEDFVDLLNQIPQVTDISQSSIVSENSKTRSFFPSDGVVLAKSQKAFPGVKESDTEIMEHNNHFQVRNSSETERVLRELYDGSEFDQFFRLTE